MIIHFTNNLENIISILESHSFKLRYCSEYFGEKDKIISSAAHPMVCFSEYSESELESKHITYGEYAIAMSKSWAVENGLSPVLYVEKNSQAVIGLAMLLKARQKRGKDALPKNLRLPIMQVKCFTKHETGYNSYFLQNDFCFKYENEWRYVPTKKQIDMGYISINNSTYVKNKVEYNRKLESFPLKFDDSDVDAIYIKTNEEIKIIKTIFMQLSFKLKLSSWKITI